MSARVMGLDLSMTASGVATPDGATFTIRPGDSKLGDRRLTHIRQALEYYADRGRPTLIVAEKIPTAGKGFNVAVILAMVHGIAREVAAARSIPWAYVDNRVLKQYATGNGAAEKRAMIVAANRERFAVGKEQISDDNEADAWWCRAIGCQALGHRVVAGLGQLDTDLKDLRDRLVRKIEWPGGRPPGHG
jgi:Holliday junction resolvasome RuvABC endonuclease subunit